MKLKALETGVPVARALVQIVVGVPAGGTAPLVQT